MWLGNVASFQVSTSHTFKVDGLLLSVVATSRLPSAENATASMMLDNVNFCMSCSVSVSCTRTVFSSPADANSLPSGL